MVDAVTDAPTTGDDPNADPLAGQGMEELAVKEYLKATLIGDIAMKFKAEMEGREYQPRPLSILRF